MLSHTTHLTVSGKVHFLHGPFFEPYRSLMAFHDSNDQQLSRRRLPLDNQWGVVLLDAYANGSLQRVNHRLVVVVLMLALLWVLQLCISLIFRIVEHRLFEAGPNAAVASMTNG